MRSGCRSGGARLRAGGWRRAAAMGVHAGDDLRVPAGTAGQARRGRLQGSRGHGAARAGAAELRFKFQQSLWEASGWGGETTVAGRYGVALDYQTWGPGSLPLAEDLALPAFPARRPSRHYISFRHAQPSLEIPG